MQFNLDDQDESVYAPQQHPSGIPRSSGGIVSGGSFGESALVPYRDTPTVLSYVHRINPNLAIIGGCIVGGFFALQGLIQGLGVANPNNAMLETQRVQAEAYKSMVTATSESLKTVANQRPACVAIVCNFPDTPQAQTEPAALPPAYQPPAQPEPQSPNDSLPDYYQDPPSVLVNARTAPTDGRTVAYWRFHRSNQQYIDGWFNYCQSSSWQSQECSALYQALFN